MKFEPTYSMRGKTCLVTGATSGIGTETAVGLAGAGANVLIVARDEARGRAAAADIQSRAGGGTVTAYAADLAVQADIRDLARQVQADHPSLDVLVHNAAAVHATRQVTPDGLEATLAVNHLAPFLLTRLLEQALRAAPAARVVNVSSYMHTRVKQIPWDDLQAEQSYSAPSVYNLTKLMNVLFTYELARRWGESGPTANALHPGWPLKTNLGREQTGASGIFDRASKVFGASAEKGSRTSVYLSTSPDVAGVTGKYFAGTRQTKSSALSHDADAARRCLDESERAVHLTAH